MFAGHIGAAMLIGRVERRVNLGLLVFAATFLDFLLWGLILMGAESVTIPAHFVSTHQPEFVFPYSHSLLASIAWSLLAGVAVFFWYPRLNGARWRAAALVAVAVFSHWLLDVLVHAPEMTVWGGHSLKLGLGLWRNMPVALTIEALIALAGLVLFVSDANLSRAKTVGLSAYSLCILAFTIIGMTIAPPPPSAVAMAASSLATVVGVCLLAYWLGAPRQST